jgi:Kef-type K+ transport system membrane component KefB
MGMGTTFDLQTRFNVQGRFSSDNSFLQVGDELGFLMMIFFLVLNFSVLRRLRRRQATDATTGLPQALFAAGAALALVGMLHHVWLGYGVAWGFWGLAGLALGAGATPGTTTLLERDTRSSDQIGPLRSV